MDPNFIEDFRGKIIAASQHMSLISESESQASSGEADWSPKQVLGHLIDSAANNHQRFVRAQFNHDLVFPTYDQESWIKVQRYDQEPWQDLIQFWKYYNLHIAHLMASVPEQMLTEPRKKHNLHQIAFHTVSENEPVSLEYLMRDYVDHLEDHLRQLFG